MSAKELTLKKDKQADAGKASDSPKSRSKIRDLFKKKSKRNAYHQDADGSLKGSVNSNVCEYSTDVEGMRSRFAKILLTKSQKEDSRKRQQFELAESQIPRNWCQLGDFQVAIVKASPTLSPAYNFEAGISVYMLRDTGYLSLFKYPLMFLQYEVRVSENPKSLQEKKHSSIINLEHDEVNSLVKLSINAYSYELKKSERVLFEIKFASNKKAGQFYSQLKALTINASNLYKINDSMMRDDFEN